METRENHPGRPGVQGGGRLGEGGDHLGPLVRRKLLQARWELRSIAGTRPAISSVLIRRSGVRIGPATDIVIEGFPRCGNTFAVNAFLFDQPDMRVAHHVHVPAQLIEAVRRGIPALSLTRDPEEAVLSLVIRLPHLSIRQALRAFVRFHEPLLAYRAGIVVADLSEVIEDFGAPIRRVNHRFGSSFAEFHPTEENVAQVLARVDESDRSAFPFQADFERSRARPSEWRERLKDELRGEYRRDDLARLRVRADGAYRTLVQR
jgi:hypothetical protein